MEILSLVLDYIADALKNKSSLSKIFENKYLYVSVILISLSFIAGRVTSPSTKTHEITKVIESKVNVNTNAETKNVKDKVKITHIKKTKKASGDIETITDIVQGSKEHMQNTINQTLEENTKSKLHEKIVEKKNSGIELGLMVGKSINDITKNDYLINISYPIIGSFKINAGYEFNNKTIFLGGSIGF